MHNHLDICSLDSNSSFPEKKIQLEGLLYGNRSAFILNEHNNIKIKKAPKNIGEWFLNIMSLLLVTHPRFALVSGPNFEQVKFSVTTVSVKISLT